MKERLRYEGEYNSKKNLNMGEAIDYILNQSYGTTLTYKELADILKYNIYDVEDFLKFKSIMARIKAFIMQYGYVLKSVNGIGYYILKPSQISNHCYRNYIKQAGRKFDKSIYILEHIDTLELNNDRKEELENLKTLNTQLINDMWKNIKESTYYSRKDYYNSLKD